MTCHVIPTVARVKGSCSYNSGACAFESSKSINNLSVHRTAKAVSFSTERKHFGGCRQLLIQFRRTFGSRARIQSFSRRSHFFRGNNSGLFGWIWGQCGNHVRMGIIAWIITAMRSLHIPDHADEQTIWN